MRWGFLYFCAVVAALSHLLLDYTTAYGIRLFEPFNYRWYSWDIVYIVEPLMLLALVAGLAIPGLLGLVSQEIGVRSKGPRGRGGSHRRAGLRRHHLGRARFSASPRGHGNELHGLSPGRTAARGRVSLHDLARSAGTAWSRRTISSKPSRSTRWLPTSTWKSGILFYKPAETPQLEAAKASHLGRVYLDWAAFPFTRQTTLEGGAGYLVDFQDLRYTYPGSRKAPLGAFVLLSPDGHVLKEGMNSNRPPSLEAVQEDPIRGSIRDVMLSSLDSRSGG